MNWQSILVVIIVILMLVAAIVIHHRSNKHCCGSSCENKNCSNCSACSKAANCAKRAGLFGFILLCLGGFLTTNAQSTIKRVYNEDINPMEQIDDAIAQAKSSGKYVVCQVGGNWCPWCLLFADFISKDSTIKQLIDENFIYIHVNYNPRQSSDAAKSMQNNKMLQRLGNPARFGYPVFVILDEKGKVIHIQDSSFLEEGKGYNREKVFRFFKNWTPKAVKG